MTLGRSKTVRVMSEEKNSAIKNVLVMLLRILAALFAVTFIAWALGLNRQTIAVTADAMNSIALILGVVRLALFTGIWYFWHAITRWLLPKSVDDFEEKRAALNAYRHKFIVMFVSIEIFIVQNALGEMFGVIESWV